MPTNPFVQSPKDRPQLRPVKTRFRAYTLGEAGSSYSYFADNHFTLIEARRTEERSYKSLVHEMAICEKDNIDTLHITSWDTDHCNLGDLKWILDELRPTKIEYPGYEPHTDTARECLKVIKAYQVLCVRQNRKSKLIKVDPPYIGGLASSTHLGYNDIFFHPKQLREGNSNENSTVKLFRTGMFNVASLGDVGHVDIGALLKSSKIFCSEVDVLILSHHGAKNDVNTRAFMQAVKPKLAIATTNYSNMYEHPAESVCQMLRSLNVDLCTTKRGDVIVESVRNHTVAYQATTYIGNPQEVEWQEEFRSKKADLLTVSGDNLRARYQSGTRRP